VRLGLLTNGEQWMLVDAPKGETTGFISWYARLWRYSLFMIGQAWHDHLASLGRPLPQIWVLYT
jgi:hypothetical protein